MNDVFKAIILSCLVAVTACKNSSDPSIVKAKTDISNKDTSTSIHISEKFIDDSLVQDGDTIMKTISIPLSDSNYLLNADERPTPKEFNPNQTKTSGNPKVLDLSNKSQKEAYPEALNNSKPKGKAFIEFEEDIFDFGEIKMGAVVNHKFYFSNKGKSPLIIHGTEVTCGCTVPSYPFIPIEPGETGYIGVNYNSAGKQGTQKPMITIRSNADNMPIKRIYLKGIVLSESDQKVISTSKDTTDKN